ncbi:MAG: hypothetical protein IJD97_06455 [Clostridia bacterium]|nr:hypothetical protein [Clostridia bacterium]
MNIVFPGINNEDIEYALECLDDCKQPNAEMYGFMYPYFTPGGMYGKQWWQLDSSLALSGYKWIDRGFSETSLWNFIESQKEDGRICLWGRDSLAPAEGEENGLSQTEGVSSLPKLFDVTYHILKGSENEKLKKAAYQMLKKYLEWWFSARLHTETGLITSVFEETFIPYFGCAGEYAAVDTNVEVFVGCHYTCLLAKELGDTNYAELLEKRMSSLKKSINKYLWNEDKEAFYPYDTKEKNSVDILMASTFNPLRFCIVDQDKKEKLLNLMKDDDHFNWNTIPLTSVSKKDKIFTTTEGNYMGNPSWSGNCWTLTNEVVVRGLLDSGEEELAAELALKTIRAFNHNLSEFVNPFDGKGHGVLKYAWTASQYLELLIEVIFGINYDAKNKEIIISPKLTKELSEENLALENLNVTDDISISVYIERGKVDYKISDSIINVMVK